MHIFVALKYKKKNANFEHSGTGCDYVLGNTFTCTSNPLSKDQVLPCIGRFIPAMDFDVMLTLQTKSLQISNIHTCSYCKRRIISTHIPHTERRD